MTEEVKQQNDTKQPGEEGQEGESQEGEGSEQAHDALVQGFRNTILGETYEQESEAPEWQRLYETRENYLPRGVKLFVVCRDVFVMLCVIDTCNALVLHKDRTREHPSVAHNATVMYESFFHILSFMIGNSYRRKRCVQHVGDVARNVSTYALRTCPLP